MGDAADTIYSGLATYGRIRATIGFVFAVLVGLVCIVVGVWIAVSKDPRVAKATARVDAVSCDIRTRTCNLEVSFADPDGKRHSAMVSTSSDEMVPPGSEIGIVYDPANPAHASTGEGSRWLGWVVAVVGAAVICIAGLSMYLSMRYKAYAAVEGGVSIADNLMYD